MIIINVLALVLAYLSYLIYFISEGDKLGVGGIINLNLPLTWPVFAIISFILAIVSMLKGSAMSSKGMKIKGRISLIAGIGSLVVLGTIIEALIIGFGLSLSGSGRDPFLGDKVLLGFNLMLLPVILALIYKTTKLRSIKA